MRNGEQLWDYGIWMINAIMEKRRKDRSRKKINRPTDIFNYGVRLTHDDDFVGYDLNSGKVLFEAENYDEARKVLEELYRVEEGA